MVLNTTLLYIIRDNKILLAIKKRGFAKGYLNGVGGKLQQGETVEEAMVRETQEEIGVTPLQYEKVATIYCNPIINGEEAEEIMHVFIARDYEGEVTQSEEMQPFWFDLDKIPFDKLIPDDRMWMEQILAGKRFNARLTFDKNLRIISHEFEYLN